MWLATHVVGGGQHSAPLEDEVIQRRIWRSTESEVS